MVPLFLYPFYVLYVNLHKVWSILPSLELRPHEWRHQLMGSNSNAGKMNQTKGRSFSLEFKLRSFAYGILLDFQALQWILAEN